MTTHHAPLPVREDRPRSRRPHLSGVARITAAGLALAVLAGCGLRVETPPPTEPTPDATEVVRARTVDDALHLEELARAALAGADDATAAVLEDVAGFSERHADALGGPYDSGLPDATPTPTPTPVSVAEPGELLALLVTATGHALEDADAVAEGPLARVVASVGTARGELAVRLGAATGQPVVVVDGGVAAEGAEPESPEPTATQEPGDATPDGASPVPSASAPEAEGSDGGLPEADVSALVLAHDQAGYGLEVVAARLTGAAQERAQAAAAEHRAAAEEWADVGALSGTSHDPRLAAYDLPAGVEDPDVARELARGLEASLAEAYATAVAHAPAGERADLVRGLRTASAAALTWGATPVAFPGMPEQAA